MQKRNDTTGNKPADMSDNQKSKTEVLFQQWDLIFKAFTTLTIILGSIYGLMGYFDKREKELEERKRDYEFTLYKERKETLYPLCHAAADIASSKSLTEAQKAIKTFETLYIGEVGIVAEGQVSESIKAFNEALLEFEAGPKTSGPPLNLIAQAGQLALKCKEVLDLEKVYGLPPQPKQTAVMITDTISRTLQALFVKTDYP